MTLGEGWHNNHHHYMASARQGFFWWEIDITYYTLKVLSLCGLVWELRKVPSHILANEEQRLAALAGHGFSCATYVPQSILLVISTGAAPLFPAQGRGVERPLFDFSFRPAPVRESPTHEELQCPHTLSSAWKCTIPFVMRNIGSRFYPRSKRMAEDF